MDFQAQQDEATKLLQRLIRFNTVNPPGNERELQEWLKEYLERAGFECELAGTDRQRPNLVARLKSQSGADGPILGYLSHVDTVLADPADWQVDPWSGELRDGYIWGRGALDMKSQTAAEVAAVVTLARAGWRPAAGELKIIAVVDEEAGSRHGAQWLTEERPELVRCDILLNEGAGSVMHYGDSRIYGVCIGEKGTFRFRLKATGSAGHASTPSRGENALLRLVPAIDCFGRNSVTVDISDPVRTMFRAFAGSDDPDIALKTVAETAPELAALFASAAGVTFAPTMVRASDKINVIPASAEVQIDCRVPPGRDRELAIGRINEVLTEVPDSENMSIEPLDEVVGNASSPDTPLMKFIDGWIGERDPGARTAPMVLPAFTDSRWFRAAFPDCIAYGFFPQCHQSVLDTWPLVHGRDERIDVRDLGFATRFFSDLAQHVLG